MFSRDPCARKDEIDRDVVTQLLPQAVHLLLPRVVNGGENIEDRHEMWVFGVVHLAGGEGIALGGRGR